MDLPEHILTIHEQTRMFLGSVLLGLPAGLLLDVFRSLRTLVPHGKVAVFLEDTLFAFLTAVMLQTYAVMFVHSSLRFYCALGAFLGLLLYMLTIGALWMRFLRGLHGLFSKIRCRIRQKSTEFFVGISKKIKSQKKSVENT